jgi:hypothetical protein
MMGFIVLCALIGLIPAANRPSHRAIQPEARNQSIIMTRLFFLVALLGLIACESDEKKLERLRGDWRITPALVTSWRDRASWP